MIPLHKEPSDPRELVQWALEGLRHEIGVDHVELEVKAPPNLPAITVDPEKIAWAIATLVGNSLRYVKHGTDTTPGGSIHVSIDATKEAVSITVHDDGPGIPAAKVPYLFHRKKGEKHPAGLALVMVHDVVEAHGGAIDVESHTSAQDHGTRVTLRLPLVAK